MGIERKSLGCGRLSDEQNETEFRVKRVRWRMKSEEIFYSGCKTFNSLSDP